MTSTVVFDITKAGYKSYTFPASGLLIVAIGAVMLSFYFIHKHQNPPNSKARLWGQRPWFFYSYFGFSCIWTIFAFKVTYTEYRDLRIGYEQGQCNLVEGRVENFQTAPQSQPRPEEQFNVGNTHFFYSESVVTAGFNTSVAAGGPMKEGMYVRIHHCSNNIARLEIVDDVKPKN